uniref:Uncharacterized protein n=1 Tax=Fagus sylvatica TaxID=28930 RepID=A0A2N9EQU6_FAGSY
MPVFRSRPDLRQGRRGPRPGPAGLRYGRLHSPLQEKEVRLRHPGLGPAPPRGPRVQEEALVSL